MKRICLVPRLSGVGGMVSFQHKLAAGLEHKGIKVVYDLRDKAADAILVIGGTRQLGMLWQAHRRGTRLLQRLDGMNWIHRVKPTGLRHYMRAEYGNLLLAFIRNYLADHIVYQSVFSKNWWEQRRGPAPASSSVIYNGVDLEQYTPSGKQSRPHGSGRILLVEGSLMGGYEGGLEIAVQLAHEVQHRLSSELRIQYPDGIELMIVGKTLPSQQANLGRAESVSLEFTGLVPPESIPEIDRSAHLLFSADLNAACPNSVIEALGCGLPVLAFDTGALPELVEGGSGMIVKYGGDPWKLDPPNIQGLALAALAILGDQESYRNAARSKAESRFGLNGMVSDYCDVLLGGPS